MNDKMLSLFLVLLLIFSVPIMMIYGLTQFGVIKTPFIPDAYQGLQPIYDSVYWNGYWYDSLHKGPNPNYHKQNPDLGDWTASIAKFQEYVNLNPDGSNTLLPSLKMSGGPILIDPTWHTEQYVWEIKNDQESTDLVDVYDVYRMQKVMAEWKVNVWIDGTGNEAKPNNDCRWVDAQIWIELIPQNFGYFDNNEEELYFAPAWMGVKNIEWYSGKEDPNNQKDPTQAALNELYPEEVGENFGLFAQRGETTAIIDEPKILSYRNQPLDPQIFKDSYWIRMNVDRMQADSELFWWGGWDWSYVSAHITLDVHLFVIGEWRVVLEKGDVPDLEPRTVSFGTDWFADILGSIGAFMTSPTGIFLAFLGIILAVFIILALTGALPGVVSLLAMLAGAKRKKGGG